jgi:hypothetical protein
MFPLWNGYIRCVAVKANVVSCDSCGQQLSMPIALKHAGRRDLEEGARAHAAGWGWECALGGDFCPVHRMAAPGMSNPTRHLVRLRRLLGRHGDDVPGVYGVPRVNPSSR